MNPGPKNSENTAVTFARKKFGNKRTKLQGPQKEKNTHPPALACATANQNATSTLLDHESHGES